MAMLSEKSFFLYDYNDSHRVFCLTNLPSASRNPLLRKREECWENAHTVMATGVDLLTESTKSQKTLTKKNDVRTLFNYFFLF